MKIHQSWLLAVASGGVMLGIILTLFTKSDFIGFAWLVAGLCFTLSSLAGSKRRVILLALAGGLLIGLWRGSQVYPSVDIYKSFIGKNVEITGKVSEDVVLGKDGQEQIKLKDVRLLDRPMDGQIWLSTNTPIKLKRSDIIQAEGELSEGFGSFSAAIYRADITKAVRVKNSDIALQVRDWFSAKIRKAVHEPQASLGIGFLSGQHANLPESLVNDLRILGLTHIIVASGYNLTILIRFARRWLMRVSKYTATAGSFLLIGGFVMITGASPSMNRAGIITGLSLLAWYYGRRIHPVVLLLFSAALTALINPSYLWGDLGWYLSFAAFAGVIILSPLLLDYFWGNEEPNAVLRVVVETLSAQIMTAPIIAFSFGQYAPLALLSNVLILPLIPFAMLFTFIAGTMAAIIAPFAVVAGIPAQTLLSYMTFITGKLAALPGAKGEVNFTLPYLIASYVLAVILGVWLWRRTAHDFTDDSVIE
ncbi:MAG TPA: ComEC/Rec2 family competence protein [Candidatus Saccharimonadales bacterium]|nr:ComEC/Rec2 family competence protein [Candidatus Saccharimonadales bacterium]